MENKISNYLRKSIFFFILFIGNAYPKDKAPDIRDKFKEFEPGVYFYVNERDFFLRPYRNDNYTVEKYMREKIVPVVNHFLTINYKGDVAELSNYVGLGTVEDFTKNCKRDKIILSDSDEYKKLLFKNLQTRNYPCGISSYFGLHQLFKVYKEDIFFFETKHYFLVWLYPQYKYGKDKNGSWETPPSFDELEHGSTFVMYYMKEPNVIVNRYFFKFHADSKKYELFSYYTDFTENIIENFQYEK